jgi:hypothetical protein
MPLSRLDESTNHHVTVKTGKRFATRHPNRLKTLRFRFPDGN